MSTLRRFLLVAVFLALPTLAEAQSTTPTPTVTPTVTATPTPTVTPTPIATASPERISNTNCAWFQPTSAASQDVVFPSPLVGPFSLHVTEVGTLSATTLVRTGPNTSFIQIGPALTASVNRGFIPDPVATPPESTIVEPAVIHAVRLTTGTCTGCTGSVVALCGRMR